MTRTYAKPDIDDPERFDRWVHVEMMRANNQNPPTLPRLDEMLPTAPEPYKAMSMRTLSRCLRVRGWPMETRKVPVTRKKYIVITGYPA